MNTFKKSIHETLTLLGNLSEWSSGSTATMQRRGCSEHLVNEAIPFGPVKPGSVFHFPASVDNVPIATEITPSHSHPHMRMSLTHLIPSFKAES